MSVEADGLDRLVETTQDAAAQLLDLDQVNADAGTLIVQAVQAPRRTGRLAATVAAVPTADGVEVKAGGQAAPYAPYVHARNPFLTYAANDREKAVVAAYQAHAEAAAALIKGA